jgi:hypothetical protein
LLEPEYRDALRRTRNTGHGTRNASCHVLKKIDRLIIIFICFLFIVSLLFPMPPDALPPAS